MSETDLTTDDRSLPYSPGTVRNLRERILIHGYAGEQRFNELMTSPETPLTSEQARDSRLAHYACLYGYATASLLGFIADKFGDEAAHEAAVMVDDMGMNGGAPYCDEFPYPPQVQP
ncbi:hypothetical protein QQG74_09955 [Micromonospora sp. FIMYZ51]|uniref:hypothetical protein n=1 Tax=Micromonospora sp. FIMYZ51 TaxID=3051832 RepID=UPI00311DCA15